MVLAADQDQDHGHERGKDSAGIDLHVGEHDEPSIAMAGLEFSGALGTGDAAGRIFTPRNSRCN